jgi:hypothetical protein
MRVMTFEQFMAREWLDGTPDVDSHIHAGLRCSPETKTYKRWHRAELERLKTRRDEMREEAGRLYVKAIESGEVREPTRRERLSITASGTPDNPSVRAARNLLKKNYGVLDWD